ncbi:MAG: cohesin domain-containing protein [candidate division Zixibacteria bacterium]|nr:cohesin domain-containing protein [candidate division Zixibacteria bacterium]
MMKKKFFKVIFWNFLSLLLFSGLAFAGTVPVSIPDTSGSPGDAIQVPISVQNILPSDTVRSAEMTLIFNPAIIQPESIKVIYTGTLTQNWFPADYVTDSVINIALAGADSISGSGTLVFLRFKVRSSALPGDSSVIHFTKMMFNEGAPTVSIKDGVLRITPTSVHENENLNLPRDFNLGQNYPNPFNPTTTIPFRVRSLEFGAGRPTHTTLVIYNLLGQKVNTLLDESLKPGLYQAIWNGKNDAGEKVPSGVYFYRLTSGSLSETRKMVLMR